MADTSRFGATPEEWDHFAHTLKLGSELLPVVSNPAATISVNSTLVPGQLGKVPSRYNGQHQVSGIPDWGTLVVTEQLIEQWSKIPDYGFGVRARAVGAFDLDVDEDIQAISAVHLLFSTLGCVLPIRRRAGAPRMLCPFRW